MILAFADRVAVLRLHGGCVCPVRRAHDASLCEIARSAGTWVEWLVAWSGHTDA
ncbi:hypothetical protein V475_12605 [Sphingobium baderi LL03]|uniref:Uncharacterized protein n=1 Tax=Sphingobium baderi LL03 TaxID=1114964 RepID=T0GCY6_9SPHN|nr:hypothetical protein L485_17840 [Sphingobium baderi LL03]KMS61636.1 hypothetical protein V475_12605 [Sphingobium baderi LL03]